MAKVISVGGIGKWATAGVLVAAGAAMNRLFRPFDATVPRAERVVEPLVLTFPIPPRKSLEDLVVQPALVAGATTPATRPVSPARPARPGPALLTRRGSRKAWRCV